MLIVWNGGNRVAGGRSLDVECMEEVDIWLHMQKSCGQYPIVIVTVLCDIDEGDININIGYCILC